ncbi:MAG TPA: FHA domain-containing protein, partial [bacterium]|nr:FHA domain-containing protein [bacterium]
MFFRKKRQKETSRRRESFDPDESRSDTPATGESSGLGRDLDDPTIASVTRPLPRRDAPGPASDEVGDDVTRFIGAPLPYGATFVAWLVHASGTHRGRDVRLSTGTTRIGSGRDCEIAISGDTYISSRHAEIDVSQGIPRLRDLQSTNGTFLNGKKIREADLNDGDRIRVGTSEL